MRLANYIQDLLYRYDCVIVPNFGGFITNKVGAIVDEHHHTFYPPTKQITFNTNVKHNDGLLANYIAKSEDISFENANELISKTVQQWRIQLKSESVFIDTIGEISLNKEAQLIFEPSNVTNFLTEAYGLASYTSASISRNAQKAIPIHTLSSKKSFVPVFAKYAAAAAIILTVGVLGYKNYQENLQQEFYANQEKALEQKIQSATFVISNPLPTIELNVKKEVAKPFHIIAGAFQFPENAQKKVMQLKKKGYKAEILGVNKWGLTQVTFESFSDRQLALTALRTIRENVSEEAWMLIKTF